MNKTEHIKVMKTSCSKMWPTRLFHIQATTKVVIFSGIRTSLSLRCELKKMIVLKDSGSRP